jgi:hypothetical protein
VYRRHLALSLVPPAHLSDLATAVGFGSQGGAAPLLCADSSLWATSRPSSFDCARLCAMPLNGLLTTSRSFVRAIGLALLPLALPLQLPEA